LEIIYHKKFIKKNVGKMVYENFENNKEINIFHERFVLNNKNRFKIIINNKLNELKGIIENKTELFKIKITFLDNIIKLNSLFEDCQKLCFVQNFQNLNTKYLKTLAGLFCGCHSLTYIDDISGWNMNKIK